MHVDKSLHVLYYENSVDLAKFRFVKNKDLKNVCKNAL